MDTCKHNWHFIEGTERLRCERCKVETGPKTYEERVQDILQGSRDTDQLTRDLFEDVTTMGTAWSQEGKRIDPWDVYKTTEYDTTQFLVPTGQLSTYYFKPDYNISFHNNHNTSGAGKLVGKLDFNGPELVFEGDAAESAQVFIDWIATAFHGRLEQERKSELDACCDLLEGMHAATDGNHNYYLHAANELRKLRNIK